MQPEKLEKLQTDCEREDKQCIQTCMLLCRIQMRLSPLAGNRTIFWCTTNVGWLRKRWCTTIWWSRWTWTIRMCRCPDHSIWANSLHIWVIGIKRQRISPDHLQLHSFTYRHGLKHADNVLVGLWEHRSAINTYQCISHPQFTILGCGAISNNALNL